MQEHHGRTVAHCRRFDSYSPVADGNVRRFDGFAGNEPQIRITALSLSRWCYEHARCSLFSGSWRDARFERKPQPDRPHRERDGWIDRAIGDVW